MSNSPLLLTFLRGTLRKDSSGSTREGQAGLGVQGTVVDFHRPGRPRSSAPSRSSQHQRGPGGSKGRACALGREVLTMWPSMASLGASSCHLDAFFWSPGGHLPRPTCAQVYPLLRGFVWFLWGEAHALLSLTISTVFRRKFSFSFRSQLSKKFMSGIRNF